MVAVEGGAVDDDLAVVLDVRRGAGPSRGVELEQITEQLEPSPSGAVQRRGTGGSDVVGERDALETHGRRRIRHQVERSAQAACDVVAKGGAGQDHVARTGHRDGSADPIGLVVGEGTAIDGQHTSIDLQGASAGSRVRRRRDALPDIDIGELQGRRGRCLLERVHADAAAASVDGGRAPIDGECGERQRTLHVQHPTDRRRGTDECRGSVPHADDGQRLLHEGLVERVLASTDLDHRTVGGLLDGCLQIGPPSGGGRGEHPGFLLGRRVAVVVEAITPLDGTGEDRRASVIAVATDDGNGESVAGHRGGRQSKAEAVVVLVEEAGVHAVAVVVDAVDHLDCGGGDLRVGIVAVGIRHHCCARGGRRRGGVGIPVSVSVLIGGTEPHAVAVVVEGVRDLVGVGVDRRIGVVAIRLWVAGPDSIAIEVGLVGGKLRGCAVVQESVAALARTREAERVGVVAIPGIVGEGGRLACVGGIDGQARVSEAIAVRVGTAQEGAVAVVVDGIHELDGIGVDGGVGVVAVQCVVDPRASGRGRAGHHAEH